MRVFVDGRERDLDNVHEYALGPLRIHARDDLAAAYNRVVKQYVEAKTAYEEKHGITYQSMVILDMETDPDDIHIYEQFSFAIQEAIEFYDGPPIDPERLEQLFLLRV